MTTQRMLKEDGGSYLVYKVVCYVKADCDKQKKPTVNPRGNH